jgi:hypothetical protein
MMQTEGLFGMAGWQDGYLDTALWQCADNGVNRKTLKASLLYSFLIIKEVQKEVNSVEKNDTDKRTNIHSRIT